MSRQTLLITIAVIATGAYIMRRRTPLNVRNNNPLNIKKDNRFTWRGEVGQDSNGFVVFDTVENGFRAAYKNLQTYKNKYGLDSIYGIVNRWAPESDSNPVTAYMRFLADSIGAEIDQALTPEHYPNLILAMSYFEGAKGRNAFSLEQVENGISLA